MKKRLVLFLFISNHFVLQAQYPIPDPAFATALQQIVPNAMTGNIMDETHPDVQNLTEMYVCCSSIADLDGIGYFISLEVLDCAFNSLTTLAPPPSLRELYCKENSITSIAMPQSLEILDCSINMLSGSLSLPNTLKTVRCGWNQLTAFPSLPDSLNDLECSSNSLTGLPTIPSNLTFLACQWNQITILPPLPTGLTDLDCGNNSLTSLPTLPSTLEELDCRYNQLTQLPALPASLTKLTCTSNDLTSLPTLPNGLLTLFCAQNQLSSLPSLPAGISTIYCGHNALSSLPTLPTALQTFGCWDNVLTSLPALPNMINFYCGQNQLTALPALPISLINLQCHENQITSIPPLPDNLGSLQVQDNLIDCLPQIPNSVSMIWCADNFIQCLPNIPTSYNAGNSNLGFPLTVCDVANSSCSPLDEAATGRVFHDDNGNGIQDPGEPPFTMATIEAQPGDYLTSADADGNYVLPLDIGSFTLDGQDVPYHIKTTSAYNPTLAALEIDSLNHIGYQVIPGIYDLVVDIEANSARPGFDNVIWVHIANVGTETTSAAIELNFDTDQNWVASSITPDTQVGNMATWSPTLDPGDQWSSTITLNTPVSVPLGTPIDASLTALPAMPDTTLSDNTMFYSSEVVGSYDPNDKLLQPAEMTTQEVQAGEFIEYTIRFQNTGTFPAERVVITDTLSADLNWGSMEYISGSHANTWFLQNGVLHFVHDPIFLPDSNSNEPESHGYVKFRMEPMSTLLSGEQIENVANIYFDFNEPVITNPAVFTVSVATGVAEMEEVRFELFPNPTNGGVTIIGNEPIMQVDVLQSDGRLVRSISANASRVEFDIPDLVKGVYVVQVSYSNAQSSSQLLMVE